MDWVDCMAHLRWQYQFRDKFICSGKLCYNSANPPLGEDCDIRETLVGVKSLKTYFYTEDGTVRAVDGVDFEVYQRK